jgi:hypothetical protein
MGFTGGDGSPGCSGVDGIREGQELGKIRSDDGF